MDLANWQVLKGPLFVLLFALVACIVSAAIVVCIIVWMPPTYFNDKVSTPPRSQHQILRWIAIILKNMAGIILVVFGGVMLFTPGQGVLTIAVGIMLLDFPGKRKLVRAFVGRAKVRKSLNDLRARFGKPPFEIDTPSGDLPTN